ncbi:MAG: prepilin peptidase [Chloroflexota bacterium]
MDIPLGLAAALAAGCGAAAGSAAWLALIRWVAAFHPGEAAPPGRWPLGLAAAGAALGLCGALRNPGDPAALLALGLCGPVLLFLLAADLRVRRVPVAGAAALALAGLAAAPARGGAGLTEALAGAFAGFAAAGALWAAGRVVARRGGAFGAGDVLLAAGAGLALGWPVIVTALFAGSLAAAAAAAVMAARGGGGGVLPWGAFLCGATLLALALTP